MNGHSNSHNTSPSSIDRKPAKKTNKLLIPKVEVQPLPSLIQFPSEHPQYYIPSNYFHSQNQVPLTHASAPLYSNVPLYDHTPSIHPHIMSQYNPFHQYLLASPYPPTKLPAHTQVQLSVNGYGHMYDEPHPLTHYPNHPPPRYEESVHDQPIYSKPLTHPPQEYTPPPPPPVVSHTGQYNTAHTDTTGSYYS